MLWELTKGFFSRCVNPPGEPLGSPAANAPIGLSFVSGPTSQCAPYRGLIEAKLIEQLSYQDPTGSGRGRIHGPFQWPPAILPAAGTSSGFAGTGDGVRGGRRTPGRFQLRRGDPLIGR